MHAIILREGRGLLDIKREIMVLFGSVQSGFLRDGLGRFKASTNDAKG